MKSDFWTLVNFGSVWYSTSLTALFIDQWWRWLTACVQNIPFLHKGDILNTSSNKKAELSQRWPRDAPYVYGHPDNFQESLTTNTATFPEIFNGLLIRLCLQNLKSVALPVPEIIGVPDKIGQSLDTPTLPFSQKFLMGLCSDGPSEYTSPINLKSVAFPVPEIIGGTPKNLGSPWICPRLLFSKIFHGLLFGWTLWMHWLNLKSIAFAVPEIIGGT